MKVNKEELNESSIFEHTAEDDGYVHKEIFGKLHILDNRRVCFSAHFIG